MQDGQDKKDLKYHTFAKSLCSDIWQNKKLSLSTVTAQTSLCNRKVYMMIDYIL